MNNYNGKKSKIFYHFTSEMNEYTLHNSLDLFIVVGLEEKRFEHLTNDYNWLCENLLESQMWK